MQESPIMITKENIVTAAIIRKDDKILIAQRKKDSYLEPNKWEFPGGKVEENETNEDCLVREIQEELGIVITIDSLFLKTGHVYEKDGKQIPITLFAYLSDLKEGKISHIDCQDSRWIEIDEISYYEFAEADIPIVKKLMDVHR